jgi:hypothetical protein
MTKQPPSSEKELLDEWFRRVRESQFAHYEASKSLVHKKYFLGVPVVVLSALSGAFAFATLGSQSNVYLQILFGFVSVFAAVLASLQTFLQHSERAEKHRSVAGKYGSLRREIELLIAGSSTPYDKDKLALIKEKINLLSEEAPEISQKTWQRTDSILEKR